MRYVSTDPSAIVSRMMDKFNFYEFFAGGGMARAGLGAGWNCLFANDISSMKAQAYRANWGEADLVCGDVADVAAASLPGTAGLAWASFPCQDLSLAGNGKGLGHAEAAHNTRSGAFWPFWTLVQHLLRDNRAPRMIVLENVPGVLTSHKGADFAAICAALAQAGYAFGAMAIDARLFVPQSRQRVFIVAVRRDHPVPARLLSEGPRSPWHPRALVCGHAGLPGEVKSRWLWWNMPVPSPRTSVLANLIEEHPASVAWHTAAQTQGLLGLMSPANLAKVAVARMAGSEHVGCLYRRTRPGAGGQRLQRAEVRFDGIAGCLRTPGGGSSRQSIILVKGDSIRTRLLSTKEAARLMGLSESYRLPDRYNDAYHVAGDGVCVPVVRHLARHVLEPVLAADRCRASLMAAE